MNGGDVESCVAYYCLHKLEILPSQFINLPVNEKAFIVASIQLKIEHDKKEAKKIKAKRK
ncbi:MAG: hypothetical protein J6Y29_02930 [Clostridiales bacterium]|nr:hypothetical protein [Clostridiales bacterium]